MMNTMKSDINISMRRQEWIMLLILSVLWGGSFFFVEIAIKELPPLTIVTLRLVFASLTLWIILLSLGHRVPISLKTWTAFLLMGMLNNVIPFSLIVWGQTYITSGLASILNATTPLFTVIIAGILLTDEQITPQKLLGIIVGFFGVLVLVGTSAFIEVGTEIVAQIAVLGAAVSYAFAGIYGRRFKEMGINPIVTATGQITMSAIALTPLTMLIEQPQQLKMPSTEVWLAIISLAVLSTALAYILYFRILSTSGATNLLLVTFLIPISAILLGSVFLGEGLKRDHLIGIVFIGISLSIIDGRIWSNKLYKPRR